ncbi:DNA sulfur modification protein DndE [Paenibacillus sp. Soil766]|uniref:DNA sulfur modification protein DndE n=1 Tax=Paenibacillus sp. Soil766 TaxID=1736404 RepID=UPI0007111BF5|nr:DNA sulfur modification protein DndE [Paenibacillus sp. Soil766]KRF01087.1 DNA sulfur modification protein DndE [Paenibacillus sp. Soil766]
MQFRLKTSKSTADRLKLLQDSTGLTPNILSRIAIMLSLREPKKISALSKDVGGIEFNRNTLTGTYDYVFKALITHHEEREITDEEYFPNLFNAHLERGSKLLENEYQYAGNYQKFITNLVEKSGISKL